MKLKGINIGKGILVASLCTVVLISMIGCSMITDTNASTSTKKKTTTQTVTKGTLQVGLVSDGKIERSFTSLDFEVAGILKKIYVKIGDHVKKGQTLAKLDDTDLQQALTNAENQLSQAQASYNEAVNQRTINLMQEKLNLNKAKETYENNKNDYNLKSEYLLQLKKYNNLVNSDSSIINANLKIEEANNAVDAAKENLSRVVIKAPSTGEIVNIAKKVGELVDSKSVGFMSDASSAFMVLCDPKVINVTANITETDIVGLSKISKISVAVDAAEAEGLPGKITKISNLPSTDSSGIVTYSVTGKLDKAIDNIRDGMNCVITILKKEVKNTLMVPVKAVFLENNVQYVNVQGTDGTITKKQVVCGISNGVQTAITSGVTEGEIVVIGGVSK